MTPWELFEISVKNNIFVSIQQQYLKWIIIELAINILKSLSLTYFLRTFCGVKKRKKYYNPSDIVFTVLYALISTVEYFFCGFSLELGYWLAYIPLILLTALYVGIFLNGSPKDLFIAAFIGNFVMITVNTVCSIMANVVLGQVYIMLYDIYKMWAVTVFSPLLTYFTFFVILRMFKKSDITDKKPFVQWTILSWLLVISIAVSLRLFINFAVPPNGILQSVLAIIIVACVILSDIFVYLLLSDIIKKNEAVNELNLIKQTEEYNKQYMEHLRTEYETVRKLRHDYKNSFLVLSELLKKGETEKAVKCVTDVLGEISGTEIFINTNNEVVNAVANAKLSAAKSLGIDCECLVAKDISGIKDVDLCRLLSNMLDNAVTACKNDGNPHRRIELTIRTDDISCSLYVKNTVPAPVLEANPELKSTKSNLSEHGMGIGIIREIASKYSGSSDFYEEDGMFCCGVILRKLVE